MKNCIFKIKGISVLIKLVDNLVLENKEQIWVANYFKINNQVVVKITTRLTLEQAGELFDVVNNLISESHGTVDRVLKYYIYRLLAKDEFHIASPNREYLETNSIKCL